MKLNNEKRDTGHANWKTRKKKDSRLVSSLTLYAARCEIHLRKQKLIKKKKRKETKKGTDRQWSLRNLGRLEEGLRGHTGVKMTKRREPGMSKRRNLAEQTIAKSMGNLPRVKGSVDEESDARDEEGTERTGNRMACFVSAANPTPNRNVCERGTAKAHKNLGLTT